MTKAKPRLNKPTFSYKESLKETIGKATSAWSAFKTGILNINSKDLKKSINNQILCMNLIFMILTFFLIGRVSSFSDNFQTFLLLVFSFFSIFLIHQIAKNYIKIQKARKTRKRSLRAFLARPRKPPDSVKSQRSLIEDDISSIIPEVPTKGIKDLTPPGSVGRRIKSRKFKIERIRISEARVDLIDDRPHIQITLPDNIPRMALFDTGASSCSISREVLRQVEKVVPVARAETNHNFTLQGVIPGITIPVTEIVYLPIALQNGHVIHSVPMVVIDHGTDLIIGANMVRTYKWASYWEEGKYFIDVGKDLTPVPARFQPSSELTGVSINCVQLQPKE
jgi:hypothetical protein